ncbi:GYDIA family GHMP kinase [Patiriisocius hiemis]|uniref:GYDIA family GHMP kinase n=1 Tax=Patiriisocius hiemis TaxID=3075604 RepID=A0ABU2YDK8_9FLAO|nr:GYDIA family GHMP kinase [Constantimarinum sp. W242]MDT0556268.1 GYDIA family GHMP kinase [Constantimarinum sp. W242]
MKQTFYSNGKLLLTGEYVVLDGATALAIPTKFGQSLTITHTNDKNIHWKSLTNENKVWYEEAFVIENLEYSSQTNLFSETLQKILHEAKKLNQRFLSESHGFTVETKLDFPRNWGLGTSSTLLNNIAQWAKVDAYELLEKSFGGSGYDIATAQHDYPVLYNNKRTPRAKKAHLPWEFTNNLFFVYLNKKQDSKEGIAHYKSQNIDPKTIEKVTDLTNKLLLCYDLPSFEKIITAHELLISKTIKQAKIKEKLFSDYPHIIKSLGAWGGDFVLVVGDKKNQDYFKNKGYKTIIPFSEMIIN